MNPAPLSKTNASVDSHVPKKRTYRRRTVPYRQPSSTINRRHGDNGRDSMRQDIIVPLPIKSTVPLSWILSSATQVLVEHLLFSRGVIPLSVAQLSDKKHEEVLKSRSQRRKLVQCRSQLESWHLEWSRIDCSILENCSCILISLGPSFLRSREFYILNVAEERRSHELQTSNVPPIHALGRRLLPRLVESDTDLPCRLAPSFQLSVSLFVQAAAWEKTQNDESRMELSNLFIRRPGFKLPTTRTKKENQRVVSINILDAGYNSNEAKVTAAESICDGEGGHYWMSLRRVINGFRLSA